MNTLRFWLAALLTTCVLIGTASFPAFAVDWSLVNSNSSLNFDDAADSTISTSIYNWSIDASVSRVYEMGLYYRIGSSTPEYPVKGNDAQPEPDTAAHFTVVRPAVQSDPSAVTLTYLSIDGRFKINVASRLTGGAAGSKISSLNRHITITNLTASALDFHLFSFNDFELSKPSNYDNVVITNGKAIQSGFASAADTVGKGVTAVESASIKPDLFEMDTQSLIGSLANGSTPYNLDSSSAGPWPTNTDVQFALQWNFNIPASGSVQFDLNDNIYPTKALTLAKTPVATQCVNFGQPVTYTYAFDNAVNTASFPEVHNVRLVEKLPKDVSFVSATDGGTFDSLTNSVVWSIPALTASSKTVQATYLVNSLVSFTMQASVFSDETYPTRLDNQIKLCNSPPSIDTLTLPNAKEASPYSSVVTASDPDAGTVLTFSLNTAPAGMTINSSTGAISWTPTAAQVGSNSLVVKVSDGTLSTTKTFTILVSYVNTAPVFTSTPVTTATVGTLYTYNAVAIDQNKGDKVTYFPNTVPEGMVIDPATGVITWTPAATQIGPFSVSIGAYDTGLLMAYQSYTVTVSTVSVDKPPVITNPGNQTSNEGSAISLQIMASDPDGTAVTFTATGLPTGLTINNTGLISGTLGYTSAGSYNSSVTASSGGQSVTASFTWTVANIDQAPQIANPGAQSSAEGSTVNLVIVASDPDGTAVTFSATGLPTGLSINATTGAITGTVAFGAAATNNVVVTATSNAKSVTASFTWTVTNVNVAPVLTAIANQTLTEDTAKTVALSATDADGDAITYSVTGGSAATVAASISGSTLTLTPAANYNTATAITFTVTANDGNGGTNSKSFTATVTAVNDAPVATAQSVTTAEDTAKVITLAGSDVEGSALTYTIVSAPTHGTLSGTGNSRTYTPAANYNGADSFTFTVNDGTVSSAAATVSISVTAVNDAPVLAAIANQTLTEDTVATVTLSATDADGDAISYSVTGGSAATVAAGISGNTLTLTPAANYNTTTPITFTVTANDGNGGSNIKSFTATVTAVNDVPVATAQSVSTNRNTAKAIVLAGSDPEGSALTYAIVAQPANGTLSGTAPNLTYTPAANYTGADSFTFTVRDGSLTSAAATVSINVTFSNVAPVATAQSVTTAEDSAKAITLAATDSDGDALTYTVVTQPTHGTLSGTVPNLTYTPAADYNGADSFTFKANDGTVDSANATVSITVTAVNDAPLASAQSVTTAEDTAKVITLAGSDPEGSALTYAIATQPAHGTLSGTGNSRTYTPAANYNGADSFTFTVNDGSVSSAAATVSINVTAVNDAPVLAAIANQTMTEDTVATVTLSATDADGDAISYSVTGGSAATVAAGISGSTLTLTPAANYNTTTPITFTVTANDGNGGSNIKSFTATVTAVNDVPVATAQSVSTNRNTAKAIVLAGSDPEGSALTYAIVAQPANGTLSGTAPNLTYTPAANYTGADSFTFTVRDGSLTSTAATVSINVTFSNVAPVATAQSVTTAEDSAKAITLAATDTDGDALTYTVVTQPTHGTLSGTVPNLTYTPAADYNGADSFTFKANDGTVDSAIATVSITVTAVNDAPVASAQSVTTAEDTAKVITLAGSDPEGSALTYAIATQPAHGTLSGTGNSRTYTPAANYNGADSFTFTVNDGSVSSAAATVSINVTAVNDAPVLAAIANQTLTEDTVATVTLSATDADGDAISYSVTGGSAATVAASISGNTLTLTPAANYNTTTPITFTVTANDGNGGSNIKSFTATVTAVNDVPVATAQSVSTNRNTAKAIVLAGSDPEGSALTYAIVAQPANGTLSGTAPNLTYTPAANYTGADSFTFTVRDGSLTSTAATVSINVTFSNVAPVATAQSVTTAEDSAKAITLAATDSDGDALTYTVVTQPTHGTLSGTVPNLTYTPAADYNGADSFTFKANDGTVDSANATVSITVTAVNDAPVASAQSVTTAEDTAKVITLAGSDVEGSALTYTIVSAPTHGTLSGTGNSRTYTPAANYNGADSFTFTVNDGTVSSAAATVSINVTAVNDAPVLAAIANQTLTEDTVATVTLSATDADGDAISYSVTGGSAATVAASISGNTLTLTPAANYNTTTPITFTVTANDGNGGSNIKSFTATVTAVNDVPVATAQSVSTNRNTAKAIVLAGSDPEGSALTYAIVAQPANGTLSGTAPNLTYTPAANYTGADSFTFTVRDGSLTSAAATVSINVTFSNVAPVATAQSVTTAEDSAKAITLAATDSDGDALTYTVVTQPTHGTLSGTVPNLTYTPAADYNGADSFTFKANDGTVDSANATVSITVTAVNDAPVASAQSVTTAEDTAKVITLAGSDVEGSALTYTIVSAPTHGTLSGTGNSRTYTPAANYNGADSFTFTVNDGSVSSAAATVSINVTVVNDAPVVIKPANQVSGKDTAVTLQIQATDVDGDAITYSTTGLPTGLGIDSSTGLISGTATAAATYNVTVTVGDATTTTSTTFTWTVVLPQSAPVVTKPADQTSAENSPVSLQIQATDANGDILAYSAIGLPAGISINSSTGLISGTPGYTAAGSYNVAVTVTDGAAPATASFIWTVTDVDRAPAISNPGNKSNVEGSVVNLSIAASDPDGTAVTYSATGLPTGLAINSTTGAITGAVAIGAAATNNVTITAVSNGQSATASFTWTVTSKTTPTITWITPAPVNVGTALSSTQLNATATVSGTFVYTPVSGTVMNTVGNQNLSVVFTPADTVNYNSATASVILTVNSAPALQVPVINSTAVTSAYRDGYYYYAVMATDPNGNNLSYSLTTKPSGMTINSTTGLIYWRPSDTGTYSVTVKVLDPAGLSATQSFKVAVVSRPDNSSPKITSSPVTKAVVGVLYNYDVTATDSNGDNIYYRLYTAPSGMTIDLNTGLISWVPTSSQTGSRSVTVQAVDSKGGKTSQSFTCSVSASSAAVNSPPVITNPGSQTSNEGSQASLQIQASDPESDTISFSATGLPSGLSINSSTGLISGIVSTDASTGNTAVITVSDGNLSTSISFSWDVTSTVVNNPPVITSSPITTAYRRQQYIYTVIASDPNGDVLKYELTTKPSGMDINSSTGLIAWTPSYTGTYSVTVKVSDSKGAYKTQSFSISVKYGSSYGSLPIFEPYAVSNNVITLNDIFKMIVDRFDNEKHHEIS